MTSFDIKEKSTEGSRPVEFYRFTLGAIDYTLTSAEDAITIGTTVWTPQAGLSRTKIQQGTEQKGRGVDVRVPSTNAFVQLYASIPPGDRGQVTITRGQRDEAPAWATLELIHLGEISGVKFVDDGHVAIIESLSVESKLRNNIPVYSYSASCDNVLYGPGCNVDPAPFSLTGVVTAVSDTVITVTGAGASPLDFVFGYARLLGENDYRLIVARSGSDIELNLPFATSALGASVELRAGCDHLVSSDCALVFDNVINFAGYHKVPRKDIFRTGLK